MLKFKSISKVFVKVFLGLIIFLSSSQCTNQPPTEEIACVDALSPEEIWEQQLHQKSEKRKRGYVSRKYHEPGEFQLYHTGIRTREGEAFPAYPANYRLKELQTAKVQALEFKQHNARTSTGNGVISFTERGPSNTPGRSRTILLMPQDATKSTWLVGSSGGGIWKTTDRGKTWVNKSPNFPSLAVATLAMSPANPNIIYAGTGEYIASAGTAINGDGIFRSTNGGETWTQLASTSNNSDFISVTRIIVDPANPNILLSCSAPNTWDRQFKTTIMRSVNGGVSWTKVYEDSTGAIEQIIADPTNFNIQYAAKRGLGVLKSTDAGLTWQVSNSGMSPSGRIEIAICRTNPNRLYASAVGNGSLAGADLYTSTNAGQNWDLVDVKFDDKTFDFLGGQGNYDNTVACDLFDDKVIYFGGVSLFRAVVGTGNASENVFNFAEINTSFLNLVNFGAPLSGGRIQPGNFIDNLDIEIRFGPGKKQKAHRFLVPEGATTGVPDANYSYQDYVEVPFEAWDITNNRQLNISFRDQGRDGKFTLKVSTTEGPATEQSREYVYISNTDYNPDAPDAQIAIQGGHIFRNMYFFWPTLASGATWNPDNLPESKLSFTYIPIQKISAITEPIVDVYGQYNSRNRFLQFTKDVHPDQHYMLFVPENENAKTYFILITNDGGVFYSNVSTTPGVAQGSWNFAGQGLNTAQFYGADKRPGHNQYFGGMQDNGTWQSPDNTSASAGTPYNFRIDGDGFQVLWNNDDDRKLIGGSYRNNFRRSTDGGNSWLPATSGITGESPFISRLANSKANPNTIFTVTSSGVFRSFNFGESWQLTPINNHWGASTFLTVEVSRANANIVWAGSGMFETGNTRKLHVSTNGGASFTASNNYTTVPLGVISGLATHPLEENTAYALFSFAQGPKVLRTTNLGQSWEDISGFGANTSSNNGFPDVAVYCLYVRPDNPDIIWVGSEIGIIESLDNGNTWHLLDAFPSAAVWQMKGQDNQIVMATHGRGIWTAELEAEQISAKAPELLSFNTSPTLQLLLDYKVEDNFDSIRVLINNNLVGSVKAPQQGTLQLNISNINPGQREARLIAYKGKAPFYSKTSTVTLRALKAVSDKYATYFDDPSVNTDFFYDGMSIGFMIGFQGRFLQTPKPYQVNREVISYLEYPIRVSSEFPIITYYDIAILRNGSNASNSDNLVIEASKDGRNWLQLLEPYNASKSNAWLTTLQNNSTPTSAMFLKQEADLSSKFSPGDIVLIRWRIAAKSGANAWGWAMRELHVQVPPLSAENSLISNELKLYPNPARESIYIQSAYLKNKKAAVQLTDVYGRQALSQELLFDSDGTTTINTGNYKPGQYVMMITTDANERIIRKILIVR